MSILLLTCGSAFAQQSPPFLCDECRPLDEHPIDAANFALNATFGPDSFIRGDLASEFDVRDTYGNVVTVDVNFSYDGVGFYPILVRRFPVPIPGPDFNFRANATLQAIVKDAWGKILYNLKLRTQSIEWPLLVGDTTPTNTTPPDFGDGDLGGEGGENDFGDEGYDDIWGELPCQLPEW